MYIYVYICMCIYIYVILSIHLYKTLTKSFNSNFGTEFADVNDAGEIKDKQRWLSSVERERGNWKKSLLIDR